MRRIRTGLLTLIGIVVVALGIWAFGFEPAGLRVVRHAIAPPGWPAECDGFRIAVLADLHVGSPWNGLEKLATIVARTRAAEPDLVLLVGDYVIHGVLGGRFVAPEAAARGLAPLTETAPVHAVLGNHDWWLDGPRVQRALESVGIVVLEDASVRFTRDACSFSLAGVSDFSEREANVARALARVPERGAVVVFTHHPDVFPRIPERVTLTLAGHTHGGQVFLPILGRPIVPSRYGERFASGTVVEDGRHLFVSVGLGTSILPVRFRVPPEISLVELTGSP